MSRPRLIRARTGLDTLERVSRPKLIRAWSALDIPRETVTRPKLVRARSGVDLPQESLSRPWLISTTSRLDTSQERTPLLQSVDDSLTIGPEEHGSSHPSEESAEPDLTIGLTILFALATGFTTANLYYCQPILDVLAADFNVSPAQISDLPALAQAGNAVGLLAILPVADLLPKRQFLLVLMVILIVSW